MRMLLEKLQQIVRVIKVLGEASIKEADNLKRIVSLNLKCRCIRSTFIWRGRKFDQDESPNCGETREATYQVFMNRYFKQRIICLSVF